MSSIQRKTEHRKAPVKVSTIIEPPKLVQTQLDSFQRLLEEGFSDLISKFSSIEDFTGSQLTLHLLGYEFRPPRHNEEVCREQGLTYSCPLYIKAQLEIKQAREVSEQTIFVGEFPMMTPNGTFIVSGTERVVVSQLVRSPGVYFTEKPDLASGRELCSAKVVPLHGAWLDFETSAKDVITVKVEGRRKFPITTLLRAIGYKDNEELLSLFEQMGVSHEHHYIRSTMERETVLESKADQSGKDITAYQPLRSIYESPSGDSASVVSASSLIHDFLFNPQRYNLGKVGRYKLNRKLGRELLILKGVLNDEEIRKLSVEEVNELTAQHFQQQCLTREDIAAIVWHLILINNGVESADDIDHLGNRRVRTVGELMHNQLRIGMLRLERIIKERMSVATQETLAPSGLINIRPVVTAIREFFAGSQLSQFMDQINPLAELTHKRRLSALGPGGLSRERAGFEVRDVHYSHYGRICPIETPEGPNIGLISSLATYARINPLGFIETPYRRVFHYVDNQEADLAHKMLAETVKDAEGNTIAQAGHRISNKTAAALAQLPARKVKVAAYASNEVVFMPADDEERYIIASANTRLDETRQLCSDKPSGKIEVRHGSRLYEEAPENIDLMDVSPRQLISITTSLIPFLEHDDANRALMGANMQRQAVPLVCPDPPLVGTGMERVVALNSGQSLYAPDDGVVTHVASDRITIQTDSGEESSHKLQKFLRSNQGTCIRQLPTVNEGDKVRKGQIMAEGSASSRGELALGHNVLCAFMSWRGYNFEDAVIISETLIKQDKFTSIHIEKYETEARSTKLGPEEITRDVSNVGEESLRSLDENGIIAIGTEVGPRDILVGKITPKGETELTAEEKLLRALFGEKAHKVKDTSLRMPHGERGRVISVRVLHRDKQDRLPAGVNQLVQVWVAQERKVTEGDKLTGRHGNKGVVSCILPEEDMPYLPDGTPIDIVLNPVSVPSRMNLGQILETHMGWAADMLGTKVIAPVFESSQVNTEDMLCRAWLVTRAKRDIPQAWKEQRSAVSLDLVQAWMVEKGYDAAKAFNDAYPGEAKWASLRIWLADLGVDATGWDQAKIMQEAEQLAHKHRLPLPVSGKMVLCDGRTGEAFDEPVTVGYIYMMKLIHLVEDKVHARSTGPYSLVTQQPLGGKAQFGGQRFGEMEAWALEGYGAAHTLQELLTIKSDDVVGRAKAYEHIIKGEDLLPARIPASYKVLEKELQSLCLAIERIEESDELAAVESKEYSPSELGEQEEEIA